MTVKAKDSQLYLKYNLPVTVNLSGQHRVYTIYLCTKCWWAATRRLLALNCAITLLLRSSTPGYFRYWNSPLTASCAVYVRWSMRNCIVRQNENTFHRQSVRCPLSPTRLPHLMNYKQMYANLTKANFWCNTAGGRGWWCTRATQRKFAFLPHHH